MRLGQNGAKAQELLEWYLKQASDGRFVPGGDTSVEVREIVEHIVREAVSQVKAELRAEASRV